jgi:hypothetical protein
MRCSLQRFFREKAPTDEAVHRDDLLRPPPRNWKELESHPLGDRFKQAAHQEITGLLKKGTWRVMDRERVRGKPLPLMWVFTYKFDQDGNLEKCKARIVVRGDLQEKDTLQSTYAATLAAKSFRLAMALAAKFDLEVKQFDIKSAFLNALRESAEPVFCELPDGFKESGKCVELLRALYGLRDSPLLWYKELTSTLRTLGLSPCAEEPCLFQDAEHHVLVLFYVDDILVLYHKTNASMGEKVIAGLKRAYELHDKGDISWFLGIRVIRDRKARKITLTVDSYIEKIARKFNADSAVPPSTPLPGFALKKNEEQASREQVKAYQERVGSILYIAITLRPDVAFASSCLSHFLMNPSKEHMAAANRVIKYLYGTRFLGIQYSGEHTGTQLLITSDASFGDDEDTRRSSEGYIISLFGGPIAWRAARQPSVSTSTTEAELRALTRTGKETIALERLFRDINLELGEPWRIFCDNKQTIRLVVAENARVTTALRHVDIQNMWLRQEHANGSFDVTYMPTTDMPADGLTKQLSRQQLEHFRALLNLQDMHAEIATLDKNRT